MQQIGPHQITNDPNLSVQQIRELIQQNDLRILDQNSVASLHELILQTKRNSDTLGGVVNVLAENVPAGLGSYTSWNTKLDDRLAGAVMGINAIKGVEIGGGFTAAQKYGSQIMDEIAWHPDSGWTRLFNHLGGFEGGMTNGYAYRT